MALLNLVKVNTATTGTGTITLGSAVTGYLTMSLAGAVDGTTYSYGISDGANSEVGTGVWTSASNTLTRTVVNSTNANAAISLSGTAVVFITALVGDFTSLAPLANPSFTTSVSITVATGTAPLTVASTTAVTNLNADLLDGQHGSYYLNATNLTGTLPATHGGTGLSTTTAGSYLRSDVGNTIIERTPIQVRSDIAANTFTENTTAPTSPNAGDEWLNSSTGKKYTYITDNGGIWVELEQATDPIIGGTQLYISNTQPTDTANYMWVQTGMGDSGNDFTLWINM